MWQELLSCLPVNFDVRSLSQHWLARRMTCLHCEDSQGSSFWSLENDAAALLCGNEGTDSAVISLSLYRDALGQNHWGQERAEKEGK